MRVSREYLSWALAVSVFGLGDILSTWVGISLGAVEANPVASHAMGELGVLPTMIIGKIAVLSVVGLLAHLSREQGWPSVHLPLTLAVMGGLIVGYNTVVILTLL